MYLKYIYYNYFLKYNLTNISSIRVNSAHSIQIRLPTDILIPFSSFLKLRIPTCLFHIVYLHCDGTELQTIQKLSAVVVLLMCAQIWEGCFVFLFWVFFLHILVRRSFLVYRPN